MSILVEFTLSVELEEEEKPSQECAEKVLTDLEEVLAKRGFNLHDSKVVIYE